MFSQKRFLHVFLSLERHIKSIVPLGHLNCNSLGHPGLLKCWPVTLRHPGGATRNLIQYSRKVSKLSDGIWIFGYPSPCQANPAKDKNTHTQNHIIDFKQKPPWQQFLSIKVGWITHKPPNFPSAKPTLFHVNAALVMVTLSKKHLTSWHRCSRAPLAQQLRQGQGQEKQRARCNCCDNLLGFSLKEFQLKKKWWNASQSGG